MKTINDINQTTQMGGLKEIPKNGTDFIDFLMHYEKDVIEDKKFTMREFLDQYQEL